MKKLKNLTAISIIIIMLFLGFKPLTVDAGESTNNWIKLFGTASDDYYGTPIVSGDNIYVLGTTNFNDPNGDILFTKHNQAGKVIWSKSYGLSDESDGCWLIIPIDNRDFILIGQSDSNLLLLKVTSEGEIVWQKQYASNGSILILYAKSIKDVNNKEVIYMSGCLRISEEDNTTKSQGLLMKMDIEGNLMWMKLYPEVTMIYSIQIFDNNIFAEGYCRYQTKTERGLVDILLMNINSNGEIVWSTAFNLQGTSASEYCHSAFPLQDGFITLSDYYYHISYDKYQPAIWYQGLIVTRFDKQGKIIWNKTLSGENYSNIVGQSIIQKDNRFAILADVSNYSDCAPLFVILDNEGNITTSKQFGEMHDPWQEDSLVWIDSWGGDFLMTGSSVYLRSNISGPEDLLSDALLIKINEQELAKNKYFKDFPLEAQDVSLDAQPLTVNAQDISNTVSVLSSSLLSQEMSLSEETLWSVISDTEPPQINIISPQDNLITNQKTVILKGQITDSFSGVKTATVNNEEILLDASGIFTKTINLTEGENIIKIVAEDLSNNKTEKNLRILVDTEAPQIILNSVPPLEISQPKLNLSGKVIEKGISGIKDKSIKINNISVPLTVNFSFNYDLVLQEGQNEVNLSVEDLAGNKATLNYAVRYLKKIVLKLQIGQKIMYVNNDSILLDVAPVIIENRTFLPIRWVAEPLGGTVDWDNAAKKVTVTLKNTHVELWIGNPQAKVNGTNKWVDESNHKVVPEIINGRTMIPLRFVAENLGAKVDWNSDTKTITITYSAT